MDAHVPDRSNRRFAFRMPRMSRGRVLGVAACALGGAIAVNATLFQSERHPAPMFRTLARPQVAKAEVPPPPMLRELREANEKAQRGEKAAALAAPAADPVVRDLQTELAARGYYKGEPDGKTGPATTKAIRDFQTDRRMGVDGVPSEGLLAEVRSARENMKEELFDLVKRAHAPERGDKPALRKADPAPQAKPSPAASVPKVAAKADAKPKAELKAEAKVDVKAKSQSKAKAEASQKAVAKAEGTKIHAAEKKKSETQAPQQAKARATDPAKVARKAPVDKAQPQRDAEKTRVKALAKAEPAPKPVARPRLEADAPLRPPANVAEIIARN